MIRWRMNDDRDELIRTGFRQGMKPIRLAYLFSLSEPRVKQICRAELRETCSTAAANLACQNLILKSAASA